MQRLLILCASTWGQFGNVNAAKRLARLIGPLFDPRVEIVVQPAEQWLPFVERAGTRMREIASTSAGPEERRERYLEFIGELEARFPAGFESNPHFVGEDCDLDQLAARIAEFDPQLIVGTKGFISRLAQAALLRAGRDIPIVNYVTNDGLLTLPLHRTPPEILNLVQTEFGARMLAAHPRVEVVGPLVGRSGFGAQGADPDERPLIAILCNRNPEYRRLFDALIAQGDAIRVRTIILGCPDLLAHVRATAPGHWQIWDALAVETYLDLLADVSAARTSLLVTKSAPNSVLEAVAAGIPVLALPSGLPMESWVSELVAERGLGWPADGIEAAIATLGELADQSERIRAMAVTTRAYATNAINNSRNAAVIHRALVEEFRINSLSGTGKWQSSTSPIFSLT